jgi:hypothetical protein
MARAGTKALFKQTARSRASYDTIVVSKFAAIMSITLEIAVDASGRRRQA